jgi:hypothetical protein
MRASFGAIRGEVLLWPTGFVSRTMRVPSVAASYAGGNQASPSYEAPAGSSTRSNQGIPIAELH